MILKQCPICGHALAPLDALLAEHDVRFQCHHCWNRVNVSPQKARPFGPERKSAAARRSSRARRP